MDPAKPKKRKALPVLVIVSGILLLLVLLLAGGHILHLHQCEQTRSLLAERGLYTPVPAGEYSLNLVRTGNPDGRHRIVVLAGYGVMDASLTMREMTAALEAENEVLFPDRAGCGASDDTDHAMTVEYIVEDYRRTLQNAGVEAPYVLLAHSIGGVYASDWMSRYPDEIEGAVILDGTVVEAHCTDPAPVVLPQKLLRLLAGSGIADVLTLTGNDESRIEAGLIIMTKDSAAQISELEEVSRDLYTMWDRLVTTDIPKCYINAGSGYRTREELRADPDLLAAVCRNYTPEGFNGTDAEREDAACDAYLALCEEIRQTALLPYTEKLGSCEIVDLPGDHMIYEQRPEDCAAVVQDLLRKLENH